MLNCDFLSSLAEWWASVVLRDFISLSFAVAAFRLRPLFAPIPALSCIGSDPEIPFGELSTVF